MSDSSIDCFRHSEEDGESSHSSSIKSITLPSYADLYFHCPSRECFSIESLSWNKSILNLFEVFSPNKTNLLLPHWDDDAAFERFQNNASSENDAGKKGSSQPPTDQAKSSACCLPADNIQACSTILGNERTVWFEEAKVEAPVGTEVRDDLPIDLHEYQDNSNSNEPTMIDPDNVDTESNRENQEVLLECFSSVHRGTVNSMIVSAHDPDDAPTGCNTKQYIPSQLSESIPDSGYSDTHEDALDSTQTQETSARHRKTLGRIVDLLEKIEHSINEGSPLTVRRKPSWQSCLLENGILQSNSQCQGEKFTTKTVDSRRLQLMVRLLGTIYQLLATGASCTKRELYYLHVDVGQTPAHTYSVLDDVCTLLEADPWEVNVFNTSKGLIAGPLQITLACGRTIDCNTRWGTSVPLDVGSVIELKLNAQLVLVVEKDTVFKRLLDDGILDRFPNPLVLLTGKGYPDVSTRLLLKKIADWTNVPVCGLMDADPHGIEIFCVYKFGSLAMAHQQQSLAVPAMRWIGLFPSDIELLGLQGVPLREMELKRIEQLLRRPYTAGEVLRELMFLRQLATKAEIESLYNIASDFITTVYLTQKLDRLRRSKQDALQGHQHMC